MMDNCETVDMSPSAHFPKTQIGRQAVPANSDGRMMEFITFLALLDDKLPLVRGVPERPRQRIVLIGNGLTMMPVFHSRALRYPNAWRRHCIYSLVKPDRCPGGFSERMIISLRRASERRAHAAVPLAAVSARSNFDRRACEPARLSHELDGAFLV